MRYRTLLALVVLLLTIPARADAAIGWWDWVDSLSGPGPFKRSGWVPGSYEVKFYGLDVTDENGNLLHGKAKAEALLSDSPNLKWFSLARLTAGLNNDDHLQMFSDDPSDLRHVRLGTVDFAIMRRLQSTRGVVDVGAGVSIVRIAGDGFDPIYRVGFLPRVTVTPGALVSSTKHPFWSALARVPKVYAEVDIVKGFTGSEFNNFNTTFNTKVDALKRGWFILNLEPLVWMAIKAAQ